MPDEVHRLVSELDYPMFIVTAASGGERAGCLIGFATQCSIHPPRFLVCVSVKNRTYRVARDAGLLVVHLVPADAGRLAELFGGQTGDDVDKFTQVGWRPFSAEHPAPVLDDCRNWFAGRVLARLAAGDHEAFLLEPVDAQAEEPEGGFTFHRARRIEPGHEA